jgi:hypothetical protein
MSSLLELYTMSYATVLTSDVSTTEQKLVAKSIFRDRVFDTLCTDQNLGERQRANLRDSYFVLVSECSALERDICAEKQAAWLAA